MVSVIVPVYNAEKWLDKCLDSIINQTYKQLEIVLVDDGSNDNSPEILKEYEKSDNRIVVINQENKGVSAARNVGLTRAKGDYISFIDSDDWLEKDMIKILVENIQKYDADISCCQYDHSPPRDINIIEIWDNEKMLRDFIIHKRINGSLVNKLFRRDIVGKKRLSVDIKYGEDALFLWKILQDADKLVITNKILYHVSLHNDSATGGGFTPIKMDGIKVWTEIEEDTEKMYPQLVDVIKERKASMMFYLWYDMIISKYDNVEYENELVGLIKKGVRYLMFAPNTLMRVKVFSLLISINSWVSKKIMQLIKCR